ncbi:MAG: AAA family ATPase [Gemmatales bacterium]
MNTLHRFTRIDFERFKAFEKFSIHLRHFNILVGPNNAGKSTILTAFRILAAAMRKAVVRRPEVVMGPKGETLGYHVDIGAISVSEENIFFNYDDTEPASVRFSLSNGRRLVLYFPAETRRCNLICESSDRCDNPTAFKKQYSCSIGFVPVLGPVEHFEPLYEKEAARQALFNYHAARNFRNIWYHYPEQFSIFRETLNRTWPGMDVKPPEIERSLARPRLVMFCPEQRIPREICWSGFGFQVWCQMLTHIIQSKEASLFLIDEPDIYLHAELQRQLLVLLRNLGPDILIATHSTEIITESEPDDIVLINKERKSARRLKNPAELFEVFHLLGSNLNPILTQLARTRKAVFVEGKDFQILGRFAQKLKKSKTSVRGGFAVIPVEGFNPQKIKSLKHGMETTLGGKILGAAILDKDYRSNEECSSIEKETALFCDIVSIHKRKEIENFLLVPSAIDRAAQRRVSDQAARSGKKVEYNACAQKVLEQFAAEKKEAVIAQYLSGRRAFERARSTGSHDATLSESVLKECGRAWQSFDSQMLLVPGKEALSAVNQQLQKDYGVSITPTAIIEAMRVDEVPSEMTVLIETIEQFANRSITN